MLMPKTSLQFDPGRESINDFLERLQELEKPKRTLENSVMRGLSYQAATRLEPLVKRAVMSSPAPQARGVAASVRAKRDRMIVVTVGKVRPSLSGFKGRGSGKYGPTVAYGVALGPNAHSVRVSSYRRKQSRGRRRSPWMNVSGHTRAYGNPYRVGRRGSSGDPFSGYMAGYRQQIIEQAAEEYADIVIEMVRRNGWPVT